MPDVHLFLLIHGLWGKPEHLDTVRAELEDAWDTAKLNAYFKDNQRDGEGEDQGTTPPNVDSGAPSTNASPDLQTSVLPSDHNGHGNANPSTDKGHAHARKRASRPPSLPTTSETEDLVVVVAQGMTANLTYDGVDVCASRVAWEVDQHIAALEADGRRVTKFSVLGYSLGGLVARYLVGLLNARTPSFFEQHVPVSFTTIATPNLGIPRYNTFLSSALSFLGARLMSRTGQQIYVADKYSEADPRPLLEIMADPKHVFHQALTRFSNVIVYANVVNDSTVPFPSAAIEETDPFVQWIERGLEVEADDVGLVSDWHYPVLQKKPKKKWGYHLGTLPPVLRFRWPFNYIILALFPILFPLLFILIVVRFSLDTVRSRKRLQRLARVTPASPPSPASPASPIPSPYGLSIDGLRAAIRAVERNLEQDLIQAADFGDHSFPNEQYEATQHVEHHLDDCSEDKQVKERILAGSKDAGEETSKHADEPKTEDTDTATENTPLFYPEPTIHVRMTEPQLRMVHWLNALDPVKYLAWFPDVPNSHAVIIVRDPHRIAFHERGRGILRHWATTVAQAAVAQ